MTVGEPETLRRVGRYEIVREIGRGASAVVFLARQTDLDRYVALKELAAFRAANPAFVERFLRESRVAGSLNHPNIATVYEYFEQDRTPYIAMEYLERGSLGESGSGEREAADTSLAAAEYESTFGESPYRCEAGYDTITQDFEDYDVTYCYSKQTFKSERFPAGQPFNTGCYITETGRDVTLGLRTIRDSTDIC